MNTIKEPIYMYYTEDMNNIYMFNTIEYAKIYLEEHDNSLYGYDSNFRKLKSYPIQNGNYNMEFEIIDNKSYRDEFHTFLKNYFLLEIEKGCKDDIETLLALIKPMEDLSKKSSHCLLNKFLNIIMSLFINTKIDYNAH
jgi:hypothetical protein